MTSLSFGVPVVTTSIGAEGGGLVDEYDVLVADDPDGLAGHIVRLSRDDELSLPFGRSARSPPARIGPAIRSARSVP